MRDLVVALKERGEAVTVLAGGGGVLFDALEEKGVNCRKLDNLVHPVHPLRDLAAYREIRAVLRGLTPDLVTTHSNKAGLLGRLAARSLGIPVIHTSHGFLFSGRESSAAGLFYRIMEKFAAGAADKVIVVAESEYRLAERLGVISSSKMVLVHNGLPGCNSPGLADPEIEPPRLIMVARFAAPKDHTTLLRALATLKNIDWHLTLVGDGVGRRDSEALSAEFGIKDRVSFTGVREDVSRLLADSQAFILSSKREGFPLSILEAMRVGLPVVAADVGGVCEAVEEGQSGFLFPPGDAGRLADQLCRLLEDPFLRKKMGQAGRERFLKNFTIEQMVEETISVYESVANPK